MKYLLAILLAISVMVGTTAQTIYVKPGKVRDTGDGSSEKPFTSLQTAIQAANAFVGGQGIKVKLAPGLYILEGRVDIGSGENMRGPASYTIEAMEMPDDSNWKPGSTPVIMSFSPDNNQNEFSHCSGFRVMRSNVSFNGLKFLGNANPAVDYYYPIERDDTALENISVSQCYFIGEKNSAPIQGAVYANGAAGVHVDHCVFYGCKNAVLLFFSARHFSLTHSIIYGCYESGVWYGIKSEPDAPFDFEGNVIAACNYFWASARDNNHPSYLFRNSVITGNEHYMAVHGNGRLSPMLGGSHAEEGIIKNGEVRLVQVSPDGVPKDYLHLAAGSAGKALGAGVFSHSR